MQRQFERILSTASSCGIYNPNGVFGGWECHLEVPALELYRFTSTLPFNAFFEVPLEFVAAEKKKKAYSSPTIDQPGGS